MRDRIPIAISIAALVVAILGWTPAGEAAKSFVTGKDIREAGAARRDAIPSGLRSARRKRDNKR